MLENGVPPERLLERLQALGNTIADSGQGLALIGLGSVGIEVQRLDAWSDLDFFVIARPGSRDRFLLDHDWLQAACPVAWHFRNTEDGAKLLFADGIFCEFAVFEPAELEHIPFAEGRLVWKHPEASGDLARPRRPVPAPVIHGREWLIGEALTNLLVGMARDRRGETLSALRFIQGYAVDRLLELAEAIDEPQATMRDAFAVERRFEQRQPGIVPYLPGWMQGYRRNRESALNILAWLEARFPVDPAPARAIRELCG